MQHQFVQLVPTLQKRANDSLDCFLVFVIILEIYAFQAFKTLIKSKWFLFYYVTSAIALAYIVYQLYHFDRSVGQTQNHDDYGFVVVVICTKIIINDYFIWRRYRSIFFLDYLVL